MSALARAHPPGSLFAGPSKVWRAARAGRTAKPGLVTPGRRQRPFAAAIADRSRRIVEWKAHQMSYGGDPRFVEKDERSVRRPAQGEDAGGVNEGSGRERVRCSSLVDWPVYPRLRALCRGRSVRAIRADVLVHHGLTPRLSPDRPARADKRSAPF